MSIARKLAAILILSACTDQVKDDSVQSSANLIDEDPIEKALGIPCVTDVKFSINGYDRANLSTFIDDFKQGLIDKLFLPTTDTPDKCRASITGAFPTHRLIPSPTGFWVQLKPDEIRAIERNFVKLAADPIAYAKSIPCVKYAEYDAIAETHDINPNRPASNFNPKNRILLQLTSLEDSCRRSLLGSFPGLTVKIHDDITIIKLAVITLEHPDSESDTSIELDKVGILRLPQP